MTKVVYEFASAAGQVRVEVDEPPGRGPAAVGRGDGTLAKASKSFEEAVAGIRPIAEGILAQTTDLVQAPRAVEVAFGVKLSGEMGVILASSTAEAHIGVKLSWEREGG